MRVEVDLGAPFCWRLVVLAEVEVGEWMLTIALMMVVSAGCWRTRLSAMALLVKADGVSSILSRLVGGGLVLASCRMEGEANRIYVGAGLLGLEEGPW